MPSELVIEGLTHSYGNTVALRNGDLRAGAGELTALLGPSGSGKSTMLAVVAGMIQPTSGSVRLGDCDLLALPAEKRRLGMVFQDYALWPHKRVLANVAMPLLWRGVNRAEARARAAAALERVGLGHLGTRRPSELSGGQQQRVALARAVVSEPELLLLDEPLSALDPDTRASVRADLAAQLRSLGITTILVTHDRDDAFELADKVAVLMDGQVAQHGTPQEVFEQPATLEAARFLGVSVLPALGTGGGTALVAGQSLEVPASSPQGEFALTVPEGLIRLAEPSDQPGSLLRAQVHSHRYVSGGYRLRLALRGVEEHLVIHARTPVTEPEVMIHVPTRSMHVIAATSCAGQDPALLTHASRSVHTDAPVARS